MPSLTLDSLLTVARQPQIPSYNVDYYIPYLSLFIIMMFILIYVFVNLI